MASDRVLGVKAVLDRLFLPRLATPHRDDAALLKLLALIQDERPTDFASAARAHDLAAGSAARLARTYCGLPLMTLMMRTRFLRALAPLLDSCEQSRGMVAPPGYYDRSHFNRDAIRFLGMSPKRFLDLSYPYAVAARRARDAVIGSPLPALDRFASVRPSPGTPHS